MLSAVPVAGSVAEGGVRAAIDTWIFWPLAVVTLTIALPADSAFALLDGLTYGAPVHVIATYQSLPVSVDPEPVAVTALEPNVPAPNSRIAPGQGSGERTMGTPRFINSRQEVSARSSYSFIFFSYRSLWLVKRANAAW